jgi:DNA repair protein RadC
METPSSRKPALQTLKIYDVRLVQSRRSLRLAEATLHDGAYAARALYSLIGLTDREHMMALFVNAMNQVTGAHTIATGGQHGIVGVDSRTVFRAAITACASGLVLGHNHPSGDPSPSPEDLATTKKLMAAGRVVGIPVVDHVIVTRERTRWLSMLAAGMLPDEA